MLFRVVDITDPENPRTYPFQSLKAVPLSVRSEVAQTLARNSAVEGQVLRFVGGEWIASNDTPEIGTVSQIDTGQGLTGGPITGSGTISVADGGVTSAMLADGSIVDEDVSDSASVSRTKLASGNANYVLVNDSTGVMSELAILPLTSGGTGASSVVGARANLGLGTAALRNVGLSSGELIDADEIPSCALDEKIRKVILPVPGFVCVTGTDATKLPLAGGSMSGNINMNTNAIINLANPVLAQDAATKGYVDGQISGGAPNQWTSSGGNVYRSSGRVGIGTSNPAVALDVNGQVKITGGVPGAGKVLTSDATGLAVWQSPSTTATPIGAAGGALAGTYPNPALANNSVNSSKIADGSIVNADISASAAIAWSKISKAGASANDVNAVSTSLPSAHVVIGSGSNVATARTISGNATLSNTGVLTITNGAVTDPKIVNVSGAKVFGNIPGNSAGFTGSLGGDVVGTQGATSVTRLRGRNIATNAPAVNQVLTWNGSSWIPSNLPSSAPTGAASGDLAGNYPSPVVGNGRITAAKIATGAVTNDKVAAGVSLTKISSNARCLEMGTNHLGQAECLLLFNARDNVSPGVCWSANPCGNSTYRAPDPCPAGYTEVAIQNNNAGNPNSASSSPIRSSLTSYNPFALFYRQYGYGCGGSFIMCFHVRYCARNAR